MVSADTALLVLNILVFGKFLRRIILSSIFNLMILRFTNLKWFISPLIILVFNSDGCLAVSQSLGIYFEQKTQVNVQMSSLVCIYCQFPNL